MRTTYIGFSVGGGAAWLGRCLNLRHFDISTSWVLCPEFIHLTPYAVMATAWQLSVIHDAIVLAVHDTGGLRAGLGGRRVGRGLRGWGAGAFLDGTMADRGPRLDVGLDLMWGSKNMQHVVCLCVMNTSEEIRHEE